MCLELDNFKHLSKAGIRFKLNKFICNFKSIDREGLVISNCLKLNLLLKNLIPFIRNRQFI